MGLTLRTSAVETPSQRTVLIGLPEYKQVGFI
jgi:hypothetical protein